MDILRENIGLLQPLDEHDHWERDWLGRKYRTPVGQRIARGLGTLGGYMLASHAHRKYGDKNDNVGKWLARGTGMATGASLGQALYNKMTGKGWSFDRQYKKHYGFFD